MNEQVKYPQSSESAIRPDNREKEVQPAIIRCTPVLTAEQFLEFSERTEAIIVITFATGTIPDRIVPAIERRINQGVAVIALSDNPRDDHGILQVTYDAGSEAYEKGMVGLQKMNVNGIQEVAAAISAGLKSGLRGKGLAEWIGDRYAFGKDEEKPLAEWER